MTWVHEYSQQTLSYRENFPVCSACIYGTPEREESRVLIMTSHHNWLFFLLLHHQGRSEKILRECGLRTKWGDGVGYHLENLPFAVLTHLQINYCMMVFWLNFLIFNFCPFLDFFSTVLDFFFAPAPGTLPAAHAPAFHLFFSSFPQKTKYGGLIQQSDSEDF